jgi:hypothetical protein
MCMAALLQRFWCPRPAFECFVLAECIGKFLILFNVSVLLPFYIFRITARSGATFFVALPSGSFILPLHALQLMNSEHRPFDELRCGINEPFYLPPPPFGNAIHHTGLKLLQPLCADWRPTIGAELSAGHDFWL